MPRLVVCVAGWAVAFCACFPVFSIAAHQARAEIFNGIEFPGGAGSFVDSIWRFDPDFSGGPAPTFWQPFVVLGPPIEGQVSQALGQGGLFELAFDDNRLVGGGTSAADLYVGEAMGTPERVYIALHPTEETFPLFDPSGDLNEDGYFELGGFFPQSRPGIYGYVIDIDIERFFPGIPSAQLQFDRIQLVDDPNDLSGSGGSAGFDLFAVGAISSMARDFRAQHGDSDHDGDVDLDDLNLVRNLFGTADGDVLPFPGDTYPYDNRVDLRDLNEVRNNFGDGTANHVPEPSSFALLFFGVVGIVAVRWASWHELSRCGG